jgi:hypothetical protein
MVHGSELRVGGSEFSHRPKGDGEAKDAAGNVLRLRPVDVVQ